MKRYTINKLNQVTLGWGVIGTIELSNDGAWIGRDIGEKPLRPVNSRDEAAEKVYSAFLAWLRWNSFTASASGLEVADEAVVPFWDALCVELNALHAPQPLTDTALETLRNYFCCMVASLPHHVLRGVTNTAGGAGITLGLAVSDNAKRHLAVVAQDLIANFGLTHSGFSNGCDDQNLTRFGGEERPPSGDGRGPEGVAQ